MKYDIFAKLDSGQNSNTEYLSNVNLNDITNLENKKICVAVAFLMSVTNFSEDITIINEPLKYISEQEIIAQENHLVKTDEAVDILRENWDLSILVARAEFKLKEYFGCTPLYLEAVGQQELLLSVTTNKNSEEALETLHKFDNDWWIENEPLAKGKLCIDVVLI